MKRPERVDTTIKPHPKSTQGRWAASRRGDGTITGYIEVWWAPHLHNWVSIPGASRAANEYGELEQ